MRSRRASHGSVRPLNCGVMRNHLPHRGAPLYFALTFLTSGFFGLVWIFLMNRDIQQVHASHAPNLNRVALFAVLYPVSLGVHEYAVNSGLAIWVVFAIRAVILLSSLAVVWLIFGGILSVARYLREQRVEIPGNVVLILLTFFFFFSLALLQRRINALASRNRQSGVIPSVVPDA
jgi:hypothetical protein